MELQECSGNRGNDLVDHLGQWGLVVDLLCEEKRRAVVNKLPWLARHESITLSLREQPLCACRLNG